MSVMNALHRVYRVVKRKLIGPVINACVLFPKADKLNSDKILFEIQVASYHSDDIKLALDKDVDRLMRLYAVGAKKDVYDACEMVDEIAKSAPIDRIRFLQVHKAGIELLRIHKVGNDGMERAAFLDVNEYKRSLREEISRRTSILLTAGMAVTFMTAGAKFSDVIGKLV
jgi:hypothetical protein